MNYNSDNLRVLQPHIHAFDHLLTHIRNKDTPSSEFRHYADRLMRILAEEGLASFSSGPKNVKTPTGDIYVGIDTPSNITVVSIIRAGDSLLHAVMQCDPKVSVGKILIQRDESTKEKTPVMYYSKLPPKIAKKNVLLVDPMLATGGSVKMAIKTLLDAGVSEKNIVFLNVISCPEGIEALSNAYPAIRIVTGVIDPSLNDHKYIVPGLGDFGDRYFDTL